MSHKYSRIFSSIETVSDLFHLHEIFLYIFSNLELMMTYRPVKVRSNCDQWRVTQLNKLMPITICHIICISMRRLIEFGANQSLLGIALNSQEVFGL